MVQLDVNSWLAPKTPVTVAPQYQLVVVSSNGAYVLPEKLQCRVA